VTNQQAHNDLFRLIIYDLNESIAENSEHFTPIKSPRTKPL